MKQETLAAHLEHGGTEKSFRRTSIQILTSKSGYIATLDGWRGVAIICVIVAHCTIGWRAIPGWARLFAGLGPKGVQLFFAISGILITSRLIEEYNWSSNINLRAFYVRRACRILPPAMTYLLVLGLLFVIGVISLPMKPWAASALFCRNYFGGLTDWYTDHFWSLSVEEQFYLIWPTLLAWLGLRNCKTAAFILISMIAAWRWFDFCHNWGSRAFPEAHFWFRSDIIFDGLLWGCLYALLLQSEPMRARFRQSLSLAAPAIPFLLIAPAAVSELSTRHQSPWSVTAEAMLLPAAVTSTILNPSSVVGNLLESTPIRWVGRLSYSLYIWQQAFLRDSEGGWLLLRLAAVFVCGCISFYFIERPLTRLGHRWAPPATPGHIDLAIDSSQLDGSFEEGKTSGRLTGGRSRLRHIALNR